MLWDHPLAGMFEPLPGLPQPEPAEPAEDDDDSDA